MHLNIQEEIAPGLCAITAMVKATSRTTALKIQHHKTTTMSTMARKLQPTQQKTSLKTWTSTHPILQQIKPNQPQKPQWTTAERKKNLTAKKTHQKNIKRPMKISPTPKYHQTLERNAHTKLTQTRITIHDDAEQRSSPNQICPITGKARSQQRRRYNSCIT